MLDEEARLSVLYRYRILETPREEDFDDIVALVAQVLGAPIAAINLIDRHRQWFKAEIGLGVREMPLDDSICKFALLQSGGMVIPDLTEDERFSCNPLVSEGPNLRFYAGELLNTAEGLPLGTLCVLDTKARPEGLTDQQRFALKALAKQVMAQLELRLALYEQATLIEQQKAT
ncbi:MAG: GAF domain-containing protein, partial [Proteobacteria bacterium]